AAEALEHAIHVTSADSVVGQGEIRIELYGTLEVFDRSVTILARQRAEDEPRKQIASAQVLFVRCRILRGRFRDARLFGRTQFNAQPFDDSLRDRVLEQDDV